MMRMSLARWINLVPVQLSSIPLLSIQILLVGWSASFCQAQSVADDLAETVYVFVDGTWSTPEAVGLANQQNELIEEYGLAREQALDTFDGQIKLAHWCKSRSLIDRSESHLKRALVHNPENRRVRSLLGHVNRNGEWYTPAQIDHHKRDSVAARQRYRDWRQPVLEIAKQMRSRTGRIHEMGVEGLVELTDPRSVTAFEEILTGINEPIALQAVDAINRFPQREATESILRIALMNPFETVREHALDLLPRRNRYDYVPNLIRELVSPVSTRVSITPDGNGNVLYQYVLLQQNMERDVVRQFDLRMRQNPGMANRATQVSMTLEASRRAGIAESEIDWLNEQIHRKNSLLQYSLRRVTDVDPGEEPEDWWQWWYDENDVYSAVRPVSYIRFEETEVTARAQIPSGGECLVAGTPIWTDLGPRPVESLQTGDRVLCQDPDSWKLEYRPVLHPTTRPTTPTFRLKLDNESIQASGGHLFWVEGSGWTMTRDLQAGSSLRTASDSASAIRHIERSESLPLYNLVVDGHANYFVGSNKILSHDSTILARGAASVEPTANQGPR